MSTMGIDQVLAQIRSISAQTIGSAPGALQPQAPLSSAGVNSGANAVGFADLLKQGIDAVNSNQQSADALASAWERGAPGVDLARVMVESQKASVSFEALAQVRNRLVSVYQDIMNMQI